jgi:hypothetical protein
MMYVARRFLIPLLLIGVLVVSCGGQPAAGEPTPDVNGTVAAGAQTMVASVFQTQTAAAPTSTDTPLPTLTPLPTSTALTLTLTSPTALSTQPVLAQASPFPTGTFFTQTPSSTQLAVGCNNLRLISSYTEPEGPFQAGQQFTQYWQVENNGTCNWMYLYHLVFVSGNRMGGSPGRLSKVIPPYKWTTLSVNLTAPRSTGTHTATWRFADQGGTPFGANLPVSIKVEAYP